MTTSKIIFNKISNNRPSNARTRFIKRVNEKNKLESINLGTLYLDYNDINKNEDLYKKLTHNEIIQCKEFISTYNKTRRCKSDSNNDNFKAHVIYFNDGIIDMLYEISEYAESKGVTFMPKDSIFENLLDKLTTLDKQIDLTDIFSKYNFQPNYKTPLFQIKNTERQTLVKAFLNLNDNKAQLINAFNDYLHDCYNVTKKFTYEMLEEVTTDRKDRAIRSYVMSACIDMLVSYGVNPCKGHPNGMIFYYWYSVRLKQFNAHQAINHFLKEFEINDDKIDDIYLALTDILSKPILPNHILIA